MTSNICDKIMNSPNFEFVVAMENHGQRLDIFLSSAMPHISREKIKKLIKADCCKIDGQIVNIAKTQLIQGQHIYCTNSIKKDNFLQAEQGPIDIFWQDKDILLINKPFGITVHPCPSCTNGTLIQRIITYFPILQQQDSLRPGIVHRLDKDTSGLMIIALNEPVRIELMQSFAEHKVRKEYLALVHGIPPQNGIIDEPIGRHPKLKIKMDIVPENKGGKPAKSKWTVLYSNYEKNVSLLAIQIFSGRTHQIRVHMNHLGYPLLGDSLYPKIKRIDEPKRQMLHAWKIAFEHPVSSEYLDFCCPPPADFTDTLSTLTKQMRHIVITGSLGCGKSSFTKYLMEQKIPTWSADAVIHEAYLPHAPAWKYLLHCYGQRYIKDMSSPVNRTKLGLEMQKDPTLKYEVEQFTHRLAKQSLDKFWLECQQHNYALAVAEIPLYLEVNWQHTNNANIPKSYIKDVKKSDIESILKNLIPNIQIQAQNYNDFINSSIGYSSTNPIIIGISCPQKLRYERIGSKRNWTWEKFQQIESWQWPEQKKMKACHYVVDNSGEMFTLQEASENLLAHFAQLRNLQQLSLNDL